MFVSGIHHIAIVSADARRSADFYTRVLGFHLVKETRDEVDPLHAQLIFGDEEGRPGTLISCVEYPGFERGHPGIGGTHHFAMIVETPDAQLMWKRRLMDLGLKVTGPYNRVYFTSIYFTDPDGAILEIATRGPGFTVDEAADKLGQAFRPVPLELMDGHRDEAEIAACTWPEPVPDIRPEMRLPGLHHITVIGSDIQRTRDFYTGVLDIPLVKQTMNFDDPTSPHDYYALRMGEPGTVITYFERSPEREPLARAGAGQPHHFALAVAGDAELEAWRERLLSKNLPVTVPRDHGYYRSIQFADPFGQILEIATSLSSF